MIRSFAVITTDANQIMSQVHNRMPVILEEADWPVWLGEREGDPTALLRPAQDTLRPRRWTSRPESTDRVHSGNPSRRVAWRKTTSRWTPPENPPLRQ